MKKIIKIRKWLDTLIFARSLYNDLDHFNLSAKRTLSVCGVQDYIHLYACLEYVAKTIGVEVKKTEGTDNEIHFYYKDVKFLQLGHDDGSHI